MGLFGKISTLFQSKEKRDFTHDFEDTLFESGLSPRVCMDVMNFLESKGYFNKGSEKVKEGLKQLFFPWIREFEFPFQLQTTDPKLCFFVGVNGVGKTTSIAKFAFNLIYRQKIEKNKITFAAGDTFRAAAASQLKKHAEKLGCDFVQQKDGADPAAVIFDAVQHAKSLNQKYVLADTAGRMNTRKDLVAQLKKIYSVAHKVVPEQNITVFMVLDGNNGLVSLNQVQDFSDVIPLSAFVFTKYDGSTRGGLILSVCKEKNLPCAFLGTGETYSDLISFKKDAFFDEFLS